MGTACPSGYTSLTWNQKGPQGPGGVTSVTQYVAERGNPGAGGFGFLVLPAQEIVQQHDTAAQVTGTVDEASEDGNGIHELLGVCYEPVSSSTVTEVSDVAPEFAADADSFFAETVSGLVGGIPGGKYSSASAPQIRPTFSTVWPAHHHNGSDCLRGDLPRSGRTCCGTGCQAVATLVSTESQTDRRRDGPRCRSRGFTPGSSRFTGRCALAQVQVWMECLRVLG